MKKVLILSIAMTGAVNAANPSHESTRFDSGANNCLQNEPIVEIDRDRKYGSHTHLFKATGDGSGSSPEVDATGDGSGSQDTDATGDGSGSQWFACLFSQLF